MCRGGEGGGGLVVTNCTGRGGEAGKFINFVESVRPKRPYGMDVECYIDVAQVTDTSKVSYFK